jgi:4-hydroxybenzoate polyprenyltransferase
MTPATITSRKAAHQPLKRRRNLIRIAQLVRPVNLLITALCQIMVAIFLTADWHDATNTLRDNGLWLLVAATMCTAAAGYIINDYYDIKIDVLNKPARVVIGRYITRRQALFAHTLLNMLALSMAFWLGKLVFTITFISAFMLWLYSNRLKRQPLIGNITVAILTATAVMLPAIYYQKNLLLVGVFATFGFFISLIREVIKDMEDMYGDKQHGCLTLPIWVGIRKTKKIIYMIQAVFVLLIFTLSIQIQNRLFYFYILLALPYLFLIYRLYMADTRKDFTFLSSYCKWLMIAGIASMVFV